MRLLPHWTSANPALLLIHLQSRRNLCQLPTARQLFGLTLIPGLLIAAWRLEAAAAYGVMLLILSLFTIPSWLILAGCHSLQQWRRGRGQEDLECAGVSPVQLLDAIARQTGSDCLRLSLPAFGAVALLCLPEDPKLAFGLLLGPPLLALISAWSIYAGSWLTRLRAMQPLDLVTLITTLYSALQGKGPLLLAGALLIYLHSRLPLPQPTRQPLRARSAPATGNALVWRERKRARAPLEALFSCLHLLALSLPLLLTGFLDLFSLIPMLALSYAGSYWFTQRSLLRERHQQAWPVLLSTRLQARDFLQAWNDLSSPTRRYATLCAGLLGASLCPPFPLAGGLLFASCAYHLSRLAVVQAVSSGLQLPHSARLQATVWSLSALAWAGWQWTLDRCGPGIAPEELSLLLVPGLLLLSSVCLLRYRLETPRYGFPPLLNRLARPRPRPIPWGRLALLLPPLLSLCQWAILWHPSTFMPLLGISAILLVALLPWLYLLPGAPPIRWTWTAGISATLFLYLEAALLSNWFHWFHWLSEPDPVPDPAWLRSAVAVGLIGATLLPMGQRLSSQNGYSRVSARTALQLLLLQLAVLAGITLATIGVYYEPLRHPDRYPRWQRDLQNIETRLEKSGRELPRSLTHPARYEPARPPFYYRERFRKNLITISDAGWTGQTGPALDMARDEVIQLIQHHHISPQDSDDLKQLLSALRIGLTHPQPLPAPQGAQLAELCRYLRYLELVAARSRLHDAIQSVPTYSQPDSLDFTPRLVARGRDHRTLNRAPADPDWFDPQIAGLIEQIEARSRDQSRR